MGYCPIVLQENGNCIAVRHLGWARSVLQYTGLYCRGEKAVGIVLQYNCCIVVRSVLQQDGG